MKRIAGLALALTLSTGCANAYKAAYVTGAVTKEFTTGAYDEYSTQFNAKLTECDPETNEEVTTKTELDECMGPAFEKKTHDKIVTAVDVYYEAAKALTAVLSSSEPGDADMKAAATAIFESAIAVLEMFPESEKLVSKLKALAGRK